MKKERKRDAERVRKLRDDENARAPLASLDAAYVVAMDPGPQTQLLLRETPIFPQLTQGCAEVFKNTIRLHAGDQLLRSPEVELQP